MSATTLLLLMLTAAPAAQEMHQHEALFGTVKFDTSCNPAAQPEFLRGLATLHSFEFGPAIAAFMSAAEKDPSCGIAYWGIALSRWGNPFATGIKPAPQLQQGRTAIEQADKAGAKTPRERDYIAAVAKLFENFETVDQHTRYVAYRDAMERVAAQYQSDPEASTFYALALAAAADPADKTYVDQLKAGAILERLWKAQPQHPGLAHYIIHSYDVPTLAPRAIEAARRYAKIAPAAPHALHMPSHTFTRLGYWQDSIDTNIASAAAARKAGVIGEELHASDYQVYAYLQTGQDVAAKRVIDSLGEIASRFDPNATGSAAPGSAGVFALAAIPARYALERGAWAEAARLQPRPSRFAHTDAMTWFAVALGKARTNDVEGARAAVAELQKLADLLTEQKESYWAEQVAIQKLGASAWVALAEHKSAEALDAMRAAAEREDRTEKSAVTPGPLAPARELLAEMLVELKEPRKALTEFESTLTKEPNRFRSVAGAAAAATQAGDSAAARKYSQQLVTICERGDTPGRPELATARAVAKRSNP